MGWLSKFAQSVGNFVTRAAVGVLEGVLTVVQFVADILHPPPRINEDEYRKTEEETEDESWFRDFLFSLGIGAIATVAAPLIIVGTLHLIGFGTGGIVAGSIGATMMSWGAGITPWYVSIFQSIGATGVISWATRFIIGSGVAAFCYIWKPWRRR